MLLLFRYLVSWRVVIRLSSKGVESCLSCLRFLICSLNRDLEICGLYLENVCCGRRGGRCERSGFVARLGAVDLGFIPCAFSVFTSFPGLASVECYIWLIKGKLLGKS
jgi:hypothetical protein